MVGGHKRQLGALLLMAVAMLFAVSLLLAVYDDVELISSDAEEALAVADKQTDHKAQGKLDVLAGVALFGLESVGQTPLEEAARQADNAPETRMNLSLQGVFVSTDRRYSGALIAVQGKPAVYYQVGDELPQGATLGAVLSDHVQLRRNGLVERLSLLMAPSGEADDTGLAYDPARITPKVVPRPRSEALQRQQVQSLRERLQQLRQQSGDGDVQMEEQD